ncbi:MAG: CoB--CoM heterodisulfide reductase iron-sulfur subunit B family protein [Actinomycetota bacterium]|nr:CoB--CoM heterodisulfide reductase iron-sulfur subunit B family protein [Actinomycetota bacterium]
MTYSYYPGCSLHATGIAYDKSTRAVFDKVGVELREIDDWNCCGATSYTSIKKTVAYAIAARNLAIAEQSGYDVIAPCSACYYVLNKTRARMTDMPELHDQVNVALAEAGLEVNMTVPVRKPLDVLLNDIGIDTIVALQTNSISDFKPACYYGCQIVRPYGAIDEDPEWPMSMETLFGALGAQCVDYPPKVRCCGGMLVATSEEIATDLNNELIDWAIERGANCIVNVCPLCQANLDLINLKRGPDGIPILYFTQLIGLALGATREEVGMDHGLAPLGIGAPRIPIKVGSAPYAPVGGAS